MTSCFLHIGLPKTGTTSLQGNLFSRHSQLAYVGKPLLHNDPDMHASMRPFVEAKDDGFDAVAAGRNIRDRFGKGDALPLLLSEEEFSTGTHRVRVEPSEIARRLALAFPEARVLITIRRQEEVFQSLYCHLMNVGFMPPIHFREWIRHERSLPDGEGRIRLFDYDRIHQTYSEFFGEERVRVLLYENLKTDPGKFIETVCNLLGIDPVEGAALAAKDQPLNPRVNRRQLSWRRFSRITRPVPWDGIVNRLRLRSALDRFLSGGAPIHLEYEPEDLDFIRNRFAASNRTLSRRIGIDLGKNGYAV